MRTLATWEPGDLPSVFGTPAEMLPALGMIPGVDGGGFFGVAFDPREDFEESAALNIGWARETARGIEIKRHPETEILNHPKPAVMLDRWRATTNREIGQDKYDRWSNFAIECWLVLTSATRREESRRLERSTNGN